MIGRAGQETAKQSFTYRDAMDFLVFGANASMADQGSLSRHRSRFFIITILGFRRRLW
jgi:hypothetical protein